MNQEQIERKIQNRAEIKRCKWRRRRSDRVSKERREKRAKENSDPGNELENILK